MIKADKTPHPHGPENAEHELKKAYNLAIETGVVHFWERTAIPGVNAFEVITLYRKAYDAYRVGDRLTAERWARTTKHLARAFWHEAKIAYLQGCSTELPFLTNASEEFGLHEHSDTTADLLESVSHHPPPGMNEMPEEMKHYILRGRRHLSLLEDPALTHELLRAEHVKAAHEYGRVVECMALAFEAEIKRGRAA